MGPYDMTIGVLLLGAFFNTYLLGIVTLQFIRYYASDFKDPWWIRLSVAILIVTDIFHSLILIYMAWEYCVQNFDNPVFAKTIWSYTFTPVGTAVAAVVIHSFLSYRIYRLNRQIWIFILLMLAALAAFGTGVASGIEALLREEALLDPQKRPESSTTVVVMVWLGIQMGLNITIAGLMTRVLWKSKTGYKASNSVIYRLIRGTLQTGIFCTILAAGDMISSAVLPETNLGGMFAIPLGRVYTNTLLHTLNMREGLKTILEETIQLSSASRSIQIRVEGAMLTQIDEVDITPHHSESNRCWNQADSLEVTTATR